LPSKFKGREKINKKGGKEPRNGEIITKIDTERRRR